MIKLLARFAGFYFENQMWRNYFSVKPVIIYIGAANSRNLGDVLLFQAIKNVLEDAILIPNFPTSSIKNTIAIQLIEVIGNFIFKGFRQSSAIMVGGGTLLNSRYFFLILQKYFKPNLPLFIFGSGMQDIEVWGNHLEQELSIYQTSLSIGVRDFYAQKILQQVNIDSKVIGDPVLYICKPKTNHRKKIQRIGINIGCDYVKISTEQNSVNEAIKNLVEIFLEQGFEIEFFAMHNHDQKEIYKLRQHEKLKSISVWDNYHNWEEFLIKIHDFDLVIGQRLHSVVVACGSGIPCISLSYRPKCLHFMESFYLEKYCLELSDLAVEKVLSLTEEINSNYEVFCQRQLSVANQYKQDIRNFSEQVFNLTKQNANSHVNHK